MSRESAEPADVHADGIRRVAGEGERARPGSPGPRRSRAWCGATVPFMSSPAVMRRDQPPVGRRVERARPCSEPESATRRVEVVLEDEEARRRWRACALRTASVKGRRAARRRRRRRRRSRFALRRRPAAVRHRLGAERRAPTVKASSVQIAGRDAPHVFRRDPRGSRPGSPRTTPSRRRRSLRKATPRSGRSSRGRRSTSASICVRAFSHSASRHAVRRRARAISCPDRPSRPPPARRPAGRARRPRRAPGSRSCHGTTVTESARLFSTRAW